VRGVALAFALCACTPHKEPGVLRIGVIPKGNTHEFWKSIQAGAMEAGRAVSTEIAGGGLPWTRVDLIWKGPLREDDREQQIQVIEGFVGQGVDGLVLAPLDARALVRPVEEALRLRIPTVVIDSALDFPGQISFVATDNRAGGALAAARMGDLLQGKGKIILLRYQQGSASTEAREEGFLEGLRRFSGITLLSADQHAGATRDTAKRTAENLLNRFGAEVQGIFAPNEPATMGTLLALEDVGKAGRVFLVGFDATPALVNGLRKGSLHGLVVQDPRGMGRIGVETLLAHLRGRQVRRYVKTDAVMVTRENLTEPRVQALLGSAGKRS
jgi:ribose transport system substrate-binding protein